MATKVTPMTETEREKSKLYKALEEVLKRNVSGHSWYKENFAGLIEVTLTSNYKLQAESNPATVCLEQSDHITNFNETAGQIRNKNVLTGEKTNLLTKLTVSNPFNKSSELEFYPFAVGIEFPCKFEWGNGFSKTGSWLTTPYLFAVRGSVYDTTH